MHLRHGLRELELVLHDFGVFEVCLLVLSHRFPKQHCNSRNVTESRLCRCIVAGGTNCLTRLIGAIPEAIFLANISI